MRPDLHSGSAARSRPARALYAAALALAAVLAAGLVGCGYHVAGRSNVLPPDVSTIAVPAFVNRTSQYRIEQRLTEAVVSELLARTKYRVVPRPEDGDAVLRGEVTAIESSAVVFDSATGRATTILVTVRMKVSLEDRAGKVLYHKDNFLFREPYEVSVDVPVFFQQEGPALGRLARDFSQRLVSDILEGF